ncbi:MAG: prepilin-type N-terminal cleavage/methylation domain [Chthonomonadaceae bacterium]|nr:prepilin-type N-terminal cleavage/methylation domain [Chthonomonadaceae bacterium]
MSNHLRRAFTLIELMVVILMIAVMAGVVVPAYNHFYAKAQFENTARQVQDIFAFAREQAINRDTTVTVIYDPQNHAFVAQVAPSAPQTDLPVALAGKVNSDGTSSQSGETQKMTRLDSDVNVATFQVSSNPNITALNSSGGPGSGNQLHFLADGTVEGATLSLTSSSGYSAQYQLWPATGRMTRMDAP